MESSSSRSIEITVLSAEELRVDRRLIKKNAFAVVETDAFNSRMTKVDELGGSYPSWNEKLVMELPAHSRFINLKVQCKTSSAAASGNNIKSIGSVQIPVSDFIGGYVPDYIMHFLSYRLRDAKGEKNGIVNVSVRVKTTSSGSHAVRMHNQSYNNNQPRLSVQGYAHRHNSTAGYGSYSSPVGFGAPVGGVVTGIPVWCANSA